MRIKQYSHKSHRFLQFLKQFCISYSRCRTIWTGWCAIWLIWRSNSAVWRGSAVCSTQSLRTTMEKWVRGWEIEVVFYARVWWMISNALHKYVPPWLFLYFVNRTVYWESKWSKGKQISMANGLDINGSPHSSIFEAYILLMLPCKNN